MKHALDRYVVGYEGLLLVVWHLDGIPWHEADLPDWDHECWAQTRGNDKGIVVERCPCGAINFDVTGRRTGYPGDLWQEINRTRIDRGEEPPRRPSRLRRLLDRVLWWSV